MSWDLYSCRRYDFYDRMHRRGHHFSGGIRDRHLLFRFRELPVLSWGVRALVRCGVNPSDRYSFPPQNTLPTIPRDRTMFIVLDAPVSELCDVSLIVVDLDSGREWVIGLDGGASPGPDGQGFETCNRRRVYGHSDFDSTSP